MRRMAKLFMALVLIVVIGLVAGYIETPSRSASAQECNPQEEQCEEVVIDVCANIPQIQTTIPDGFHISNKQENECIENSSPQIMGESSTDLDSPQVLAETDGK